MGDAERFRERPSAMSEARFIECFGSVYEHSAWIAKATWRRGLNRDHDTVAALSAAFAETVNDASQSERLALIRAHPDLAGRAAVAGTLTAESTTEQAGAGIDQCSPAEFARFQQSNQAYRQKFDFPFVMAVKGSDRAAILAAFETRLANDYATEFGRAINEIQRIARFRLQAIAENQSEN